MNWSKIDKTLAQSYCWGGNCQSYVLADTDGLSVKQELMPPGTREVLHFHSKAQQFFFVLRGEAKFYVDDETIVVNTYQGIHIETGARHYVSNETNMDLEFLVISQPSTANDRTDL